MKDAAFITGTEADLTLLVDGPEDVAVPAEYRHDVVAALLGLQSHARRVRHALDGGVAIEAPERSR